MDNIVDSFDCFVEGSCGVERGNEDEGDVVFPFRIGSEERVRLGLEADSAADGVEGCAEEV